MNLADYLIKHDGRLTKTGKELHRLAKAAGCSASHVYLCAHVLKHPSRELAKTLADKAKGRELSAADMLMAERAKKVA